MAGETYRRLWDYQPHLDVDPGCKWPGCGGASDGSLDGEPFCADHAGLVVERWAAVTESPQLLGMLPPLFDS